MEDNAKRKIPRDSAYTSYDIHSTCNYPLDDQPILMPIKAKVLNLNILLYYIFKQTLNTDIYSI